MIQIRDHLLHMPLYLGSSSTLAGADLRGLNLWAADLRRSDLRGADLSGANLGGALLGGADLAGAIYDLRTIWPAGFNPKAHGALPWWERQSTHLPRGAASAALSHCPQSHE